MKITKYFAVIGCILILSSCSIKNTIQDAEKAVFTVYTYDKFGAQAVQEQAFLLMMKVRLLLIIMFWTGR